MSQYGFCDRLSQAIARGIQKAGAAVQLVDLRATDPQELSALVGEASAVVVPTWPVAPDAELQASIGTLLAALKPKQWVGCYDAFGGDDEPIDSVAGQLRGLGQKSAFDPCASARPRSPATTSAARRPAPTWASCSPRPKRSPP